MICQIKEIPVSDEHLEKSWEEFRALSMSDQLRAVIWHLRTMPGFPGEIIDVLSGMCDSLPDKEN